jgi:hypothetical protein
MKTIVTKAERARAPGRPKPGPAPAGGRAPYSVTGGHQ